MKRSNLLLTTLFAFTISSLPANADPPAPRTISIQLSATLLDSLHMEQSSRVVGSFTLQPADGVAVSVVRAERTVVRMDAVCENAELCAATSNPIELVFTTAAPVVVAEFNVTGLFLGRTKLLFQPVSLSTDETTKPDMFVVTGGDGVNGDGTWQVRVLRSEQGQLLSVVFTVCVSLFVVVNTFMMGTQLDVAVIVAVLKKPIGPTIGFCCQYIIMPLAAYCYARLLLDGMSDLQFGFFAVGCSPGGGMSNFWTILLDGNIDLSVTMTFFSNIAAMGMMPLWLFTLGRTVYSGRVEIPFMNVAMSLLLLIVPICFGMLFIRYKPHLAKQFRKYIKILTLCMMVMIIPFGIYQGLYIFRLITWRTLLCGLALPWTGYGVSYLVAALLCQSAADRRTIAIETGIQNGTIAILLCRLSLPEPDSDLTLVMPISVFMFTSWPLWFTLLRRKCCMKKKKDPIQINGDVELETTISEETKYSTLAQ